MDNQKVCNDVCTSINTVLKKERLVDMPSWGVSKKLWVNSIPTAGARFLSANAAYPISYTQVRI